MQKRLKISACLMMLALVSASITVYADTQKNKEVAAAKAAPSKLSTIKTPGADEAKGQLKQDYYSDPSDYHIGPLDLIEVKVLNAEEMTRSFRVDARGYINMPLIGLVQASGLTGYELEQLLAEKLAADYMQNPQVSVFIKEFTSQRVTVQGVVKKAGLYDFQGRATLLQAVSMGGGLDVKANENAVKVIRKLNNDESETMVFDLEAIRNNKAINPYLKGGDVVVVEEMLPITVEGAVLKAGIFYMAGAPTLMQAISQAGGLHDIADPSNIKVIATTNQKKSTLEYDLEKIRNGQIDDPILHQGDVVVVEKSAVRNIVSNVTNTLRGFIGFGTIGPR